MKQLIVNADDFGACPKINEAIVQAHQEGILTSASLMMNAQASLEAISLSKQNPSLKIGLHLSLCNAKSVLPKHKIPDLVDDNQNFSPHLFRASLNYFFKSSIRKQIWEECKAQIEKFLENNPAMDHLNTHNHIHMHPSIFKILLNLSKDYPQIKAIRLPWQKTLLSSKSKWVNRALFPLLIQMKRKLLKQGLLFNENILGFYESGQMAEEIWLNFLEKMPEGLNEAYCHPASEKSAHFQKEMPSYQPVLELKALLSQKVQNKIKEEGIILTTYSENLKNRDKKFLVNTEHFHQL